MGLEEQILVDLKAAMKSGDKIRVSTLRIIRSQIQNVAIDSDEELSDGDILGILSKEAKKRKESIQMYSDGGREDLAQSESTEFDIISAYLPKQLSEEELKDEILTVISKTGAQGMKDMGKVMGVLMPAIKGIADGGMAQRMVKDLLS